jgi:hypothetical protein
MFKPNMFAESRAHLKSEFAGRVSIVVGGAFSRSHAFRFWPVRPLCRAFSLMIFAFVYSG